MIVGEHDGGARLAGLGERLRVAHIGRGEYVARLAARHLIERGFRSLAFCGEPQFNWSRWREERSWRD